MPAIRLNDFDEWRPGYGLATVRILRAGTGTLASVYTDEALTAAASNPQILLEKTEDDISYGKWTVPLYVGEAVELEINSVDRTGVIRPGLITAEDLDVSLALVTPDGAEVAHTLAEHLTRRIDVRDYGEFLPVGNISASASTNTASLTEAIAVAAARGGGYVEVPEDTFTITTFTIPEGVIVRGVGRGATILQSDEATAIATIAGARAGFSRLTLDGITLVGDSVGVLAQNQDQTIFDDVELKRFETGLHRQGGSRANWRELYISNCVDGYKGEGDTASGDGAALSFNNWEGGVVDTCSGTGVDLENVDAACEHNTIRGVKFDTNTGTAVKIVGARRTALIDCDFEANTANLNVNDGSPATVDNTTIGLEINGGSIDGGTITLAGTLESVAFRKVDLKDVAITLTTPTNNILAEDCREISGVTFAGVPTTWIRKKTGDRGNSSGVTTDATATKAWEIALDHGQKVFLEGKVVGRGRNVVDTGFYFIAVSAGRPGATLNYDTQTANFTAGNVVTGATSGATARIIKDVDGGATGVLTVQDVVGTFVDNEIITDATGSATVNGALVANNAALVGTVAAIRAAQEINANWAATFVANGAAIELQVTGDASQTVEWTVDVDVVSS